MDPMMIMIPLSGCVACIIGAVLYYMLVMKPQQEKDAKAAADSAAAAAAAAAATSASPTTAPASSASSGSSGDAASGTSNVGLADWLSQGGSIAWSTGSLSATNKPANGTVAPTLMPYVGGVPATTRPATTPTAAPGMKYRTLNAKTYWLLDGANAVMPSSKCTDPRMGKIRTSSQVQSDQSWNIVAYTTSSGKKAYKIASGSQGCSRVITAPTCTGGATMEIPVNNKTTQLWNLVYAGEGNKTIFRSAACPTNGYLRAGTTGAMGMGPTGTAFVAKPYVTKKK